jgi:hypothetical protein
MTGFPKIAGLLSVFIEIAALIGLERRSPREACLLQLKGVF